MRAQDLTFAYPAGGPVGSVAIAGVSLTLEPGELLIVAGTTGSGKSTLLRLLAGLLVPDEGVVEADGVPVLDRRARGQVAIVFQNPESQFFSETLEADVAFGPRNLGHADPPGVARAALEAVGLDPDVYGQRSPFTLSGGEARRAAIAGALALQAPYLLLDEPTAGLDHRGRADVIAALQSERGRVGVAVVTHDPEEFLGVASQVLLLVEGRMAYSGPVEALLDAPEVYERAGLQLPDLIRTQLDARAHGALVARIVFEPEAAGSALLAARTAYGHGAMPESIERVEGDSRSADGRAGES